MAAAPMKAAAPTIGATAASEAAPVPVEEPFLEPEALPVVLEWLPVPLWPTPVPLVELVELAARRPAVAILTGHIFVKIKDECEGLYTPVY